MSWIGLRLVHRWKCDCNGSESAKRRLALAFQHPRFCVPGTKTVRLPMWMEDNEGEVIRLFRELDQVGKAIAQEHVHSGEDEHSHQDE